MAQVDTVRGPVETSELGTTLMHEHVFVLNTEVLQNYPDYWDEEERVGDAVDKLRALAGRGVVTIVDPTVVGLGRYIPRVQRVAEAVDLNILVATGLYAYDELPFYFHHRGPGTLLGGPEPLTEMFVRDITDGIAGTGVKAAFLKCVVEPALLTPVVERVLRAVAAAHRETGVPITLHTNPRRRNGLLAQRFLSDEGVDPRRLVVGHCGDTADLDYLTELADRGSMLGMDRFGLDLVLPFEDRVATVAALCERGYADRLVLSHDAACFIDWFPADVLAAAAPNWHYTHISDDVLPALRARGVTGEQIEQMLVHNPRRYFEPPPAA